MAALSADKTRDYRVTNNMAVETYPVTTAVTVYIGSLVAFTTIGRVRPCAAATGLRPAGVVTDVVNESGANLATITGNTAGTVKVKVAWGHEVLVPVRTAARTFINLGKTVFALTDDDVTDTTASGTALVRIPIGRIEEFTDSTKATAWVAVRVYGDASAV